MTGRDTSLILLVAYLAFGQEPSHFPAKEADAPARIRVGSTLVTPKRVRYVRPVRPKNAKGQAIAGKVVVRAKISKSGSVTDPEVVSGNPELASAALAAVRKWRYKPVVFNGEPVEVITEIEVPFQNE